MKFLPFLLSILLVTSSAYTQPYNNEWIDHSKTYYKMKVFGFGTDATGAPVTHGMVRIPYSTLQSAGLDAVPGAHFQLWRDGKEVPVYVSSNSVFTPTDYIEFRGEINNGKLDAQLYPNADYQLSDKWSLQTDTAAYFLTVNNASTNKRLTATANNVQGTALQPSSYFMHTVGRYYRSGEIGGGFYASIDQKKLYSSTYDKGEGWLSRVVRPVACGTNTSLPQSFPGLYPYLGGPSMTVKINAVGAMQNSRVVSVMLNNSEVAFFQMDYTNHEKISEQVPVSLIGSGDANFSVINLSPNDCDEMRVAMIELTYPRQFNFGGAASFNFSMPASAVGHLLQITNFNHGGVPPVLYDVANGKRYIADISDTNLVQVVLAPSTTAYNLVLTTQAGQYYSTINQLQQQNFTNYNLAANQGDYLIISHPILFGSGNANAVEQYRQYRASAEGGNYAAQIIDINDLVDQFAFGIKKHPLAVKNFLKFARNKFSAPPKHAFLVGKGVTYNEYRKYENHPEIERMNLVPTWGNPASDHLLASDNLSARPATSIGRLSAISEQEVLDYLNKVKQYEVLQRGPAYAVSARLWMKNVLQIAGANDVDMGAQIDGYLDGYRQIAKDTLLGANVTNYSKTADPSGYADAVISFKKAYENGASLITYFGHSSSSSLDFNLDDPEHYENAGKYPVFIANGCSAGNHFAFETNRLNAKSTISEKFVLAPGKGAIGYLSGTHYGVPNYLDQYTTQFYRALGGTKYGSAVGEIIQQGIGEALAMTGSGDFINRVHAETYAWHGDPAIRFNNFDLPDYAVDSSLISILPAFVSVADTAFLLNIRLYNLGKAANDSVVVELKRRGPGGIQKTIASRKIPPVFYIDTLQFQVPVVGNEDAGENLLTVVINPAQATTERTFVNNIASVIVHIAEDEIRPVYPYNYSIISQPNTLLIASTANPLRQARNYLFEMDTTALFNSPVKISLVKSAPGGVVEFDPGITFVSDQTYYWRVAPQTLAQPNWRMSSFVYKPGLEGAQQGHLYQLLESQHKNLVLDSAARYSFLHKNHSLFITNAMYPTSGTEDGHFSISVDGQSIIRSACIGSSVVINVFDSLTFRPWVNTTNPFGAAAVCMPGREYNFEYSYRTAASRKQAMDFINSIPPGSIVAVRLINDAPYNIYASHWQADTSVNGSGNSLYHVLKNQGFAALDSFYFPRTWAFVFRMDRPGLSVSDFSAGVYDKMLLTTNVVTPHVYGKIISPVFGPATNWSKVQWSGTMAEPTGDVPVVQVIGINNNKEETVLHSLGMNQQDFDISNIDAAVFPYLRLKMLNTDSVSATPYQLNMWRVLFTPVRDGAVAPSLGFSIPDTVGYGTAYGFAMPVSVAFKNISKQPFDSIAVKIFTTDTSGTKTEFTISKLPPLAAGETGYVNTILNVQMLDGLHNLYMEVNPGLVQPEQYSFNNFLYKRFYVQPMVLPVTLLHFGAVLQGRNVKVEWSVTAESNTYYVLEHSTDGVVYTPIGKLQATNGGSIRQYGFLHKDVPEGVNYYRLRMADKNNTITFSPVRRVVAEAGFKMVANPNPVRNALTITVPQRRLSVALAITNVYGQRVWSGHATGTLQLDVSGWAPGHYFLTGNDGEILKTIKIQKL